MKKLLFGLLAMTSGSVVHAKEDTRIPLEVTEKGFVPSSIKIKPGTDVTLEVTRKTDATCSTEILVPSKKINKKLPLNETVIVSLGKLEKGEIQFGCGMNMMEGGKILVR